MNKVGIIRKIVSTMVLAFVFLAVVNIFVFDTDDKDVCVCGKMIAEQVADSSSASVENAPPIQLHIFMIACLVVVGGSLGMVLLNIKMENSEKEKNSDTADKFEKEE